MLEGTLILSFWFPCTWHRHRRCWRGRCPSMRLCLCLYTDFLSCWWDLRRWLSRQRLRKSLSNDRAKRDSRSSRWRKGERRTCEEWRLKCTREMTLQMIKYTRPEQRRERKRRQINRRNNNIYDKMYFQMYKSFKTWEEFMNWIWKSTNEFWQEQLIIT